MRQPPPVVTTAQEVALHVGATVTLRGIVARSKVPTIVGVDVDASDALAGKLAEATGVLEPYTVAADPDPFSTHRSPGRYFALRSEGGLARATAVPDAP